MHSVVDELDLCRVSDVRASGAHLSLPVECAAQVDGWNERHRKEAGLFIPLLRGSSPHLEPGGGD